MGSSHVQVYSAEQETAAFFARATSTRPACDAYALQQVGGGDVIPVAIQGECSYTVYAGANAAFVVQFRPRSLRLDMGTMERVSTVYGEMAPRVEFRGEIGDDGEGADGKEPLCVYVMNRIRGISYLDFILAHNGDVAEDSPEYSAWRQTFIADAAKCVYGRREYICILYSCTSLIKASTDSSHPHGRRHKRLPKPTAPAYSHNTRKN